MPLTVSKKDGALKRLISAYNNELLKLFIDKLPLYPCVKEILENKLEIPGIVANPLYNKFQLGIGNMPENGLDRILEFV